ncbi:MAG: DUF4188 domain-containing protein [Candidatus Velthaea sp.]
MTPILNRRVTAQLEKPIVVFLIGMRVNRWWDFRRWFAVFRAMPKMLGELSRHPEIGFLHAEMFFTPPRTLMVQYWTSYEDLERFARDPDKTHFPAWREYNKLVRGTGSVGLWHETYIVEPGKAEAIYDGMPKFGLAAATAVQDIDAAHDTSRARLEAVGRE